LCRSLFGSRRSIANAFVTPKYASRSNATCHYPVANRRDVTRPLQATSQDPRKLVHHRLPPGRLRFSAGATPLVASEHNAVTWPNGDHSTAAKAAALRLSAFFAHGPAARAFAATLGLDPRSVHEGRSAVEGLDASPLPDLATPRLTFTGRFREDKGPDILVEALPLLADELGELPHCYLVGDGPMRPWLQRRTHELGLAERVRFTGWTHQPARYVAGAAVHVVPSREEAWSQSAVVAMGLGVPVVGTAVEGLPLTFGEGRGLLVAPDNPRALAAGIAGILRGEERTDLDGGRAYAARFEPAHVAEQYAAVYRRVTHARQVG
jgi:glycosyltransferase involved in cell wall biosynthesis